MSPLKFSQYQKLWFKAVHLTIAAQIRDKMKTVNEKSVVMEHLQWRLAFNLYSAGEYLEALPLLEKVASQEEIFFSDDENITSLVHQTAGRCACQLFHATSLHAHLERAYIHYQHSVETMVMNLYTMFKLPLLLLEFGRVMEYYGAFEAAHDIYGRILRGFPNFRGYFDALYRSAIVGRHLASLLTEPSAREESLNKCLDILQFLLEALPPTIVDYQIVLLYGRTLEMSTNPQTKFRAHSIYRSLFELCQNHYIAGASKNKEPVEWLEDPMSWFQLAEEIVASNEPLIAKDAYKKFMELKEKQALTMSYKHENKDVSSYLDIQTIIKLALSSASYQNYEEAIMYGEIGMKIDRYNIILRQYLAKWNKNYEIQLNKERNAIQSILSVWKGRCWTHGFRKKLKDQIITDNEILYKINNYDIIARDNLAYYAKNKYRSKFLYEEYCCKKIQDFYKKKKKEFIWIEIQKQHLYNKIRDIIKKYNRSPYQKDIRQEVINISKHRLIEKQHQIHDIKDNILLQNNAIISISKCMYIYHIKNILNNKIKERKEKNILLYHATACRIQCFIRVILAKKYMYWLIRYKENSHIAAIKIQNWIKKRNQNFYIVALKIKKKEYIRKKNAIQLLRLKLPILIKSFLLLKKLKLADIVKQEEDRIHKEYLKQQVEKLERASTLIQNFQRLRKRRFLSKLSKDALQKRKLASYSIETTELIEKCMKNKDLHYRIPGINSKSPQFISLTQQSIIFCTSCNNFTSSDILMLSLVLRSSACAVRTLVLYKIEDPYNVCYEFDLLAALRKCTSIRSVYILGGDWTETFINALIHVVHVENPRITSLVLEQLTRSSLYVDTMSIKISSLLLDYFNYSLPGLNELVLHGCNLSDHQLDSIAQGIAVNTSIKTLVLSLNFIEESGFIKIFKAFQSNRKSKIVKLDFSYNLIQSSHEIKKLFLAYIPHDLKAVLMVYLMYNRMHDFYHPVNDIDKRGLTACSMMIMYTAEDLLAFQHPNYTKRKTTVQSLRTLQQAPSRTTLSLLTAPAAADSPSRDNTSGASSPAKKAIAVNRSNNSSSSNTSVSSKLRLLRQLSSSVLDSTGHPSCLISQTSSRTSHSTTPGASLKSSGTGSIQQLASSSARFHSSSLLLPSAQSSSSQDFKSKTVNFS